MELDPLTDGSPLLAHPQTGSAAVREVEWEVSVDSTIARAHQHAARARRKPSPSRRKKGGFHSPDEAIGRCRGGLTSKVHLSCDGKGDPLSVVVTVSQRHDSTQTTFSLDSFLVGPRRANLRARCYSSLIRHIVDRPITISLWVPLPSQLS